MTEAPVVDASVEYPTSDGRPVAETPLHYSRLADAAHALGMRFESQPGAYVGVNMLVYDQRGNPRRHLSPDLFVAFAVDDREREIYKLWEDSAPSFVLEVTSKTTSGEDEQKKVRYARWGVNEVFLYDPRGEYVKPPLQGFRLSDRTYRAMATDILANGKPGFTSEALGLGLWLDRSVLPFHDPETGRDLSTPREAEAKAAAEAALRRQLEAELAELRNRSVSPRTG